MEVTKAFVFNERKFNAVSLHCLQVCLSKNTARETGKYCNIQLYEHRHRAATLLS